jgi:hypothetical protein
MKKLIVILILIAAIIGGYYLWLKWSPNKFVDGYYLIPNDAVMVVETEDPVGNWQTFSSSNMWQGMKSFPPFEEITQNADMLDEVIQSNQQVFALLGQKHLLISAHMTKPKDFDFVYYADMQEASKSNMIKASLTSIIKQFDYVHTVRTYKGLQVNEFLDPKTRDVLSIIYIKNYLVCSYSKTLIDHVIETASMPEQQVGMDARFTEVNQLTSAEGLCRVFINYKTFHQFLGIYMDDASGIQSLMDGMYFSGLDCSMQNDLILADGYSMVNDSFSSYMQALSVSGKANTDAEKIFSERASFFVSLGFNDFNTFYGNFMKSLQTNGKDLKQQEASIKKIEKLLKINVQKNMFDWMGSELAIAQYETDVLIGNKVKSIVAIKAKDIALAKQELAYIEQQIRRRTPIRFTDIAYNGYDIHYLEIKGLFKAFMGELFSKIEKPYYTIIGDYVVMSDDPKTLLLTIDDFNAQKTLSNKAAYRAFRAQFAEQTSVLAYVSPNHHFANFKGILSPEKWKSTQANQPYVRCFDHVGLGLSGDGDRMRTVFGAQFAQWQAPVAVVDTTMSETDTLTAMDLFLIQHFQANMNTTYYENGLPKQAVEMDGSVMDGIFVEYYDNGVIKTKGKYNKGLKDGTWKYYLPNGVFDRKEKYKDGVIKSDGLLNQLMDVIF